ncbi:hypothetical protein TEA_014184 [Camellia sinensis var. sinensis]|uniref:Uncharacterized protein n=1 Tax=Camellia sinensis var. sinensis TaxID=542762 RepID=A0A4S4DW75_CAMSN|nr:hypothetical protein TEA_014184 [Camellia sinensis var. sinensis]
MCVLRTISPTDLSEVWINLAHPSSKFIVSSVGTVCGKSQLRLTVVLIVARDPFPVTSPSLSSGWMVTTRSMASQHNVIDPKQSLFTQITHHTTEKNSRPLLDRSRSVLVEHRLPLQEQLSPIFRSSASKRDGFEASLCRTSWPATIGRPSGDYEYIYVLMKDNNGGGDETERLIADMDFSNLQVGIKLIPYLHLLKFVAIYKLKSRYNTEWSSTQMFQMKFCSWRSSARTSSQMSGQVPVVKDDYRGCRAYCWFDNRSEAELKLPTGHPPNVLSNVHPDVPAEKQKFAENWPDRLIA